MSKQAQLADGTILDFPDETPQAVMDVTVKRYIAQAAAGQGPEFAKKYPTSAEQGGKAGAVAPPPAASPTDSGPLMRGIQGIGRGLSSALMAPGAAIASAGNPTGIVLPMLEQIARGTVAPTATEKGGHYTAAAIPGLGPMAADIGERAGSGDIAGAATELGTLLLVPKAFQKATTVGTPQGSAEELLTRARQIRESMPAESGNIPLTKGQVLKEAVRRVMAPIQQTRMDAINRVLDSMPEANQPHTGLGQTLSEAAQERTPLSESGPISESRPSTPQFVENQLQASRAAETPEQMYERLKTQRDTELPPSQFGQTAALNVEYPKPQPFPIPAEGGTQLTAPDVNRWLGVSSKEVLRGADPGKQILAEGLLGVNKAATKANIESSLAGAGQMLDAQLKAATAKGITVDAQTPVYDAIMGAVKKLGSPRDAAFQANLNGLLDDIEAKYPDLPRLSPEQTHALKVDLGDSAKWTGTGSDDPINRVKIQIYSDLNNSIKDSVPGVAKTQDRWRNLYIANKASARSIAKDVVGTGTGERPQIKPRSTSR